MLPGDLRVDAPALPSIFRNSYLFASTIGRDHLLSNFLHLSTMQRPLNCVQDQAHRQNNQMRTASRYFARVISLSKQSCRSNGNLLVGGRACARSPVRTEYPAAGSGTRLEADLQRSTVMQPYASSRFLETRGGGQHVSRSPTTIASPTTGHVFHDHNHSSLSHGWDRFERVWVSHPPHNRITCSSERTL